MPYDSNGFLFTGTEQKGQTMSTTRDQRITDSLAVLEDEVRAAAEEMGKLVQHASDDAAAAHAGLYADVQQHLKAAAERIADAHTIILDGDPEDYAA